MAERTLTVRLRAVADEYERVLERAGRKTEDFANRTERISAWGEKAQVTGRKLTTGLTLPIAALGTAAVAVAGDFDASMREVQALTGATGSEFEKLQGQAMKMGADTQFSANEAAGAMAQLVKGGFDAQQTFSALPGVMQLAAAASIDIATAADIATNVLSGFGLQVSDLAEVNDYLAQTANASDTDVRELGEAFKYVGPVAKGAGLSLEETTAVMGLLAENGIRASQAGTGLRGAITTLLAPSDKVAGILADLGVNVTTTNGQLRPMVEILDQLSASGATTGQIMEIFGDRAGAAMVPLLAAGSDALRDFTGLLEESGGIAQNLADAKMGGLNGSLEQLRGSLETLAITAGENGLSAFIQGLAGGVTGLANAMSNANPVLVTGGLAIAGLAAASGPTIWALGKMATLYGPVAAGLSRMATSVRMFAVELVAARTLGQSVGASLLTAFGPQAAVVVGIAALAAGLYLLKRRMDDAAKSSQSVEDSADALAESVGVSLVALDEMGTEAGGAAVGIDDFRRANDEAIRTLKALESVDGRQAYLIELSYELVARGMDPEEAFEQIGRLAEAAGVELPVELTLESVGEFELELEAVMERIARVMQRQPADWFAEGDDRLYADVKAELDGVARAAALAWSTDNIAGFVEILAEAESQLGPTSNSMNYLVDTVFDLLEVSGLSKQEADNLSSALGELTSSASTADASQQQLLTSLLREAEAMEGGVTAANLAAAAHKIAAGNVSEYGSKAAEAGDDAAGAAGDVGDFAGEIEQSGDSAEDAAEALDNYIDSIRGSVEPFFDMADALRANERAEMRLRDAQEERQELLKGFDPEDEADGLRRIEDAARSVEDAYRSLEDAQRDLADARVDLQRVNEDIAEVLREDIAGRQPGTRRYEEGKDKLKDLLRKREDAERSIEDAERKVEDSVRGVTDAKRDSAEATRELQEARQDAVVTADELAEADRNVEEAQQRVAETALDVEEASLRLKDGIDRGTVSTDDFNTSLQGWISSGLIGQDTAKVLSDRIMGIAFASGIAKDALDKLYGTTPSAGSGTYGAVPPNWRAPSGGQGFGWRPDQWRGQVPHRASGGGIAPWSEVMVGEFGPELISSGGQGLSVRRPWEVDGASPMTAASSMADEFSDAGIVAALRDLKVAMATAGRSVTVNHLRPDAPTPDDTVRAIRSQEYLDGAARLQAARSRVAG